MAPAGIEPAIFRFVAQHLNHSGTVVPSPISSSSIISCTFCLLCLPLACNCNARVFLCSLAAQCSLATGPALLGLKRMERHYDHVQKQIDLSGNFHFITLNARLNPICHLLTLLGAHHILHVSRIRVKSHLPSADIIRSSPYSPR